MVRVFSAVGALLFVASLLFFAYSFGWRFRGGGLWSAASLAPAVVDVLLFTTFALHHSLFARLHVKRWIEQHASPELERPVYVWVASVIFAVVCAVWQPVPGVLWHAGGVPGALLVAAQAVGIVITVIGARQLDPLALAGLRPSRPADGETIVARGPYRLVRHPIYFGWFLMVCCAPLMNGTRVVFAAISCAYLVVAIAFEERDLLRTFGDEYARYQLKVRWKVLPGIY